MGDAATFALLATIPFDYSFSVCGVSQSVSQSTGLNDYYFSVCGVSQSISRGTGLNVYTKHLSIATPSCSQFTF